MKGKNMLFATCDYPSWTKVDKICDEFYGVEPIIKKYPIPFSIGFCFRCLEKDSGWKSKSRFSKKDNDLGFDIVVYEEDFISIRKDINAQKKIIGTEFKDYFFDIMKKYENKLPELKEINPKFLLEIEKWLIENQWIEPIEQA